MVQFLPHSPIFVRDSCHGSGSRRLGTEVERVARWFKSIFEIGVPGLLSASSACCERGRQLHATLEEHARQVQDVPLSVFDQLEAQDLVFIDSSHVAKIGSDVTFIFLRILPRLKRGGLVHFHDIFYPCSYPAVWIREGRAWNESLFLRTFLVGNPQFQLVAFNSYVGYVFP